MTLQTYVIDVDSIAVRDVPGEGSQCELILKTKGGDLVLRCIARRGRVIRLTDYRHRDRRRRSKNLTTVHMSDVKPGA